MHTPHMANSARSTRRQTRRVRRHERNLYLAVEPVTYALTRLIRNRAIIKLPRLGVVVSDGKLIREAYLRHGDFIKTGDESAAWAITQVFGPYAMLNVEGEDHREVRDNLRGIFGPKPARARARRISTPIVDDFRTRLEAGERVDVVDIAKLAAGSLMADMCGFRGSRAELETEARRLHALSVGMTSLLSAASLKPPPEQIERARELFREMVINVEAAIAADDSDAVPAVMHRAGNSIDQIKGTVGVLLVAGVETTTSALSRIIALLCDSGQVAALRADPELLPGAIDESLRYSSPVPVSTRTIAIDCELGGRQLKAGGKMLLLLRNGLRDRKLIEHGETFDITRAMPHELRLLWFGAGPHYCIGFGMSVELLNMLARVVIDLPGEIRVVSRASGAAMIPAYGSLVIEMVT